jgi:3-phosphoshikimate 1-carboxyvinyltransferase
MADLFVGNSGTSMRFLTALVSLGHGRFRIDGVARMRERPIEDLLAALRQLGVKAYSEKGNGCPPVIVESKGLNGGHAEVKSDLSSQFLSALLMVAPLAMQAVTVRWTGTLVSRPYIRMTEVLMRHFGIGGIKSTANGFYVPAPQEFGLKAFAIEPDASAASYFFAAAAITGGAVAMRAFGDDQYPQFSPFDLLPRLTVEMNASSSDQYPGHQLQGDLHFVNLLREMGCDVHRGQDALTVRGRSLRGIDVDMNDISDTVMTLAAVSCFAEGPTTIRNVAHIRHKETDRLAALATELRRVGAEVDEFADGLTITPRPLHGAEFETYNDHRMAMSMALIGLKVPGIVIKNPGCVAKTYPGFFTDLERLRLVQSI